MNDYRDIPVYSHGRLTHARVDSADFDVLCGYKWSLNDAGYAVRTQYINPKKSIRIRMHREILGLVAGDERECDHINRDRLDNRRANLRIVTSAQNQQNLSLYKNNNSGLRGVHWDPAAEQWVASAQLAGKKIQLGRYETVEDAGEAVRQFRAKHMPHSDEARETRSAPDPQRYRLRKTRGHDKSRFIWVADPEQARQEAEREYAEDGNPVMVISFPPGESCRALYVVGGETKRWRR